MEQLQSFESYHPITAEVDVVPGLIAAIPIFTPTAGEQAADTLNTSVWLQYAAIEAYIQKIRDKMTRCNIRASGDASVVLLNLDSNGAVIECPLCAERKARFCGKARARLIEEHLIASHQRVTKWQCQICEDFRACSKR